jgi:predicted anti-sigma-YlaC factor YlaD
MRDDEGVDCQVVREQLSAWVDGERADVARKRLDEHVLSCADCRDWLGQARVLDRRFAYARSAPTRDLSGQILAAAAVEPLTRTARWVHWAWRNVNRCALVIIGLLQLGVALMQVTGMDFGMVSAHHHGAMTGEHLMNESTAWVVALGVAMVIAGVRPAAAAGMATVLGVFALVLAGYVVDDAVNGQVTVARVISHVPVLLGLIFALLVLRDHRSGKTPPAERRAVFMDELGRAGPSDGRHLRSADHSAA